MNRLVSLALAVGFVGTLGACAGDNKPMIPGSPATSVPHRAGGPIAAAAPPAGVNPARMEGVARRKAALEIPLDKIERAPTQPRGEFGPSIEDEDPIGRHSGGSRNPF